MALTKVGKEGITGISNSSDANAITIDSSERVGIKSTSPTNALQVVGTVKASSQLYVGSDSDDNYSGGIENLSNTSRSIGLKADPTDSGSGTIINFTIDGTEHMRMVDSGAVLINNTARNDLGNLEVLTTIGVDNAMIIKTPESGASGSATAIKFRYNSGTSGAITFDSSSTAYATSSDYRLKENVDYTFDATTRLKQLKPCRFNFIVDADTTVDGFLAHEVSSVVPEAVTGAKDATDDDGNIAPQGIDQSKLVPLLVKTIQELEARITALEGE